MRANQERTYTVRGPGQFPTEMLRYDDARFATPEDEAIANSRGVRSLKVIGRRQLTIGRWNSFMWSVVDG
jgi:hypothetical protein